MQRVRVSVVCYSRTGCLLRCFFMILSKNWYRQSAKMTHSLCAQSYTYTVCVRMLAQIYSGHTTVVQASHLPSMCISIGAPFSPFVPYSPPKGILYGGGGCGSTFME